jgi:toxin-antitoxin system PIN domain toxin
MIAVDTNILVYAHRSDSARHDRARLWIRHLAEGAVPWALPASCIGEFVRITTHRRVFDPPSTIPQALEAVDALLESQSVRLLAPTPLHWPLLRAAIIAGDACGNLVFDAEIASVCQEHGVERILTEDRDLGRFPFLQIVTLVEEPTA